MERDYLAEARAILNGVTAILPEKAHLLALDQEYRVKSVSFALKVAQLNTSVVELASGFAKQAGTGGMM